MNQTNERKKKVYLNNAQNRAARLHRKTRFVHKQNKGYNIKVRATQ